MNTEHEDHRLVRRALEGEAEAAAALIRRLMPVIRSRTRVMLSRDGRKLGASEGDDLVQEVWLKLVEDDGRRLRAFDAERGASLEGYVGLLAQSEIRQLLRMRAAKKRGGHLVAIEAAEELRADIASPEEATLAGQLARRLGEHLDTELPARGRLVFRYAFHDHLEADEVARILGVTVQVIYNWQHKIRAAARAFLESA